VRCTIILATLNRRSHIHDVISDTIRGIQKGSHHLQCLVAFDRCRVPSKQQHILVRRPLRMDEGREGSVLVH
jgi:hypothetical protein